MLAVGGGLLAGVGLVDPVEGLDTGADPVAPVDELGADIEP